MDASTIVAHGLGIAHGLAAALVCAGVLYVAGLALVPHRSEGLAGGEAPAVIGAALYVLVCWVGIRAGIPLPRLAAGFGGAFALLTAIRFRSIRATIRSRVFAASTMRWLLAFALLYVLAYLFTVPPVTPDYLPPAWTGNIDLLTYARYTQDVVRLGAATQGGFSTGDYIYLQTPAVFHFLGALSLAFGRDPLSAVMPAQFALVALIGLLAARISRLVFRLSRPASLAVAAVTISGPFFRYLVGAYFLSTMMAMPVLLYLIWTTASAAADARTSNARGEPVEPRAPLSLVAPSLMVRFLASYVLLLYLYPFLLFAAIAAQVGIVVVTLAGERWMGEARWTDAFARSSQTAGTTAAALALLAAGAWPRLTWSLNEVRELSKAGIAGWPLDLISPLALLGWPATTGPCWLCIDMEVRSGAGRLWAPALFIAVAVGLLWLYFGRRKDPATAPQRTLVTLASGSLLVYCLYFFMIGPSYQQWKFASYSVLPLTCVVWAGGLRSLQQARRFARAAHAGAGRRLATAFAVLLSVALVGGNLVAHASDPPLVRLPGELRNLAKVDAMTSFRELTVKMDDEPNVFPSFLALYYLPSKRLHIVSARYDPNSKLSFEEVSRQRPLLLQGSDCGGIGHRDGVEVPEIGCLLMAPPSPVLDVSYPFNQTFLFLDFAGLGPRENEGRWNSGSAVTVKIAADLQRIWLYDSAYVNVRLDPYLPPGTSRQRVGLSWGHDRAGELVLDSAGWISIPVGRDDWTGGGRLRALTVTLALPDGIEAPWMYAPKGKVDDHQRLAVLLQELSISQAPRGRVVPIASAAAAVVRH